MSIVGADTVIAIASIKASYEKYGELRKALFSLCGPTEAAAGCISCQLFDDISDPGVLRIETRWKTEAYLHHHIRSDAYKRFLQLMEMGCERPTIEFYKVSELRGLDLIWEARIRPPNEINPDA